MKPSETAKIMARFQALLPQMTITRETVEEWHKALQEIPYPAVDAAVDTWARERRGFPMPSEIREIIGVQALGSPTPEEAWREVRRRAALQPGDPGIRGWRPHPLVKAAIDSIGGVIALKEAGYAEERFMRREFMAAYEAVSREEVHALDLGTVLTALPRVAS